MEKLHVCKPMAEFTIDHELVPPLPAFLKSDVNEKVWPTLIITEQAGGLTWKSCYSLPLTMQILLHQYIGASYYGCTTHEP